MIKKVPSNNNKPWSNEDISTLKELIKGNTPTKLIAYKLNRSENSIRAKVANLGLSLKPVNKSPYNRQSK